MTVISSNILVKRGVIMKYFVGLQEDDVCFLTTSLVDHLSADCQRGFISACGFGSNRCKIERSLSKVCDHAVSLYTLIKCVRLMCCS